jgi:hypothetical protein
MEAKLQWFHTISLQLSTHVFKNFPRRKVVEVRKFRSLERRSIKEGVSEARIKYFALFLVDIIDNVT